MIPGIMAMQVRLASGGGIDPNIGIVWTPRSAAEENEWFSVTYSPELNLFVAVASSGANRVMTSPDGVSWTAHSAPASTWRRVCWSPVLGLFVAVADSGTDKVMTSPDGIVWIGRSVPVGSAPFDVCWSPSLGRFVAIGYASPHSIYSSDGINWVAGTGLAGGTWVGVCWAPELARFVAVGYLGLVAASSNGVSWAMQTAPSKQWTRVAWSGERSLFVATAQDAATDNIMTSPDGITWVLRNSNLAQSLYGVTYANGLFVTTVSGSGLSTQSVLTSPNGSDWTPRGITTDHRFRDVTWSSTQGKFVAVASAGTGNRVMTSL